MILDISHQQLTAKTWGPMNCSSSVAKIWANYNDRTGRRSIDDGDAPNISHLGNHSKIWNLEYGMIINYSIIYIYILFIVDKTVVRHPG